MLDGSLPVSIYRAIDSINFQRGDITLWVSPAAIKAWTAKPSGRRGAPQKYSDLAIETALTLRLVFRLPFRMAEDFLRPLFAMMDLTLEAPDHTTLSRRGKGLRVELGLVTSRKPIHLIINSTGLSIVGEGEWAAARQGQTLDEMKKGYIDLTVDQQPYLQGYLPIQQMYFMNKFGLSAYDVNTGKALIRPEDVASVEEFSTMGVR